MTPEHMTLEQQTHIANLQAFIVETNEMLTDAFIEESDRAAKRSMLAAAEKELADLRKPAAERLAQVISSPAPTGSVQSFSKLIEQADELPFEANKALSELHVAWSKNEAVTDAQYQLVLDIGCSLGLSRMQAQRFAELVPLETPYSWEMLNRMLDEVFRGAGEYADIAREIGIASASWLPETADDFDRVYVLRLQLLEEEETLIKAQYNKCMRAIANRRSFIETHYKELVRDFVVAHAKPGTKYYDFPSGRIQLSDYKGGIIQADDSIGDKQRQEYYAALDEKERERLGVIPLTIYKCKDAVATNRLKAELEKKRAADPTFKLPGGWVYQEPESNRPSIRSPKTA